MRVIFQIREINQQTDNKGYYKLKRDLRQIRRDKTVNVLFSRYLLLFRYVRIFCKVVRNVVNGFYFICYTFRRFQRATSSQNTILLQDLYFPSNNSPTSIERNNFLKLSVVQVNSKAVRSVSIFLFIYFFVGQEEKKNGERKKKLLPTAQPQQCDTFYRVESAFYFEFSNFYR